MATDKEYLFRNADQHLHLTPERALETIDKAVEDYGPTWKDPNAELGCRYTYDYNNEPRHCIVGHALNQVWPGLAPNTEYDEEHWNEGTSARHLLQALKLHDALDYDDRTAAILQRAQALQDAGHPWGYVRDIVHAEDERGLLKSPHFSPAASLPPQVKREIEERWGVSRGHPRQ